MKYPNVSQSTNMAVNNGSHVDEVDSLFTSSCWQNSNSNLQNEFIDTHKLILDSSMNDSEIENKVTMDAIENILGSQSLNSLAELKPPPPFTGYTANLSINGIQGHHYHTISQRIPEENNNTYNSYNEQNIVSSSTCNVSADSAGDQGADTTVPNNNAESEDPTGSRDSWMDLDAWIDGACVDQQKSIIISQDGLSEFVIPCTSDFTKTQQTVEYTTKLQPQQSGSALQTLLTHGYMPLLQNRLQNGPPIKQETPSSTNYGAELISTSSPPANVVSTTENLLLTVNGRFMPQYSVHGLSDDHRIRSPDMLGQNYPHTTTTTPNAPKNLEVERRKNSNKPLVRQFSNQIRLLGFWGKKNQCIGVVFVIGVF
ncbi:hypothetical protein NQ314_007669 [Rhamnusium bicolor]|uniref:Uncharacterized protein n=1 Tax=Rhamnusium bicolor TaxID=1586634 RepID=A0AAV8YKL0_9CUCU|nr:hypothetical protein NQ314_007669 [Rhamnusium bicolor]